MDAHTTEKFEKRRTFLWPVLRPHCIGVVEQSTGILGLFYFAISFLFQIKLTEAMRYLLRGGGRDGAHQTSISSFQNTISCKGKTCPFKAVGFGAHTKPFIPSSETRSVFKLATQKVQQN